MIFGANVWSQPYSRHPPQVGDPFAEFFSFLDKTWRQVQSGHIAKLRNIRQVACHSTRPASTLENARVRLDLQPVCMG
jgi:hypothetical protein